MTSVNLVSPTDNGHVYSVRFREPLVIEPNSSVYLNYAKFKRNANVYFTNQQSITIVLTDVLPTNLPSTPATSQLTTTEITIPSINTDTGIAGYTPKELEQYISNKLNALGIKNASIPTQFFNYTSYFKNQDNNKIRIGFVANPPDITDMTLHATHLRDAGAGANQDLYTKTSANQGGSLVYDSYAFSKEHYYAHYTSEINGEHRNLVSFSTNTKISEQVGGISIAITSLEIADSVNGAADWTEYATQSTTSFTRGGATNYAAAAAPNEQLSNPILFSGDNYAGAIKYANIAVAENARAVPQGFWTIEITGANHDKPNYLNVFSGRRNKVNRIIFPPTHSGDYINIMNRIASIPLDSLTSIPLDATRAKFSFETYNYISSGATNSKMGLRIYNNIDSAINNSETLIFDTAGRTSGILFPKFFTNKTLAGTDAQKEEQLNAQQPLSLGFFAQAQNEGIEYCRASCFEKTDDNADGNNPLSVIRGYTMTFSSELGRYLGQTTTFPLNPNMDEDNADKVEKTNAEQHENESYSIFLKDLPIKNYKNIQSNPMGAGNNVQSSGYAQPIIYDVPTPYANSHIVNMGAGDIMVGTFQPNIKKELKLDNNRQVLNSIDVEIRDIETNEIAKGVINSVVNFTIQNPTN
tara:strand:- start:346 stop:2265 length:1920 start_codon:yes stop_codon:yes gene_type:complete